jgi:site-specific DNA-methyltransferase (adenine-specific)
MSDQSTSVRKSSPGSSSRHRLVPMPPAFEDRAHHLSIYQGDCREILAVMPAESVDLIFADPPYFLSNGGITCHAGRMVSVNKGAWDRSQGAESNHQFNREWLAACQRVLKPNGSIWVSGTSHVIHSVGFAMQQLDFNLLNDVSWVKPNPPPNLSCRYFTHATETIIWAAKNKKSRHTFNYKLMRETNAGKQMKSVWTIPPPSARIWNARGSTGCVPLQPREPGLTPETKFGKHPAQKPVALIERILLASSNEGDLVLDPFAGSGTTLVAAFRTHRFALSIESESTSVNLALQRIVSELVVVQIGTVILRHANNPQIDLDPHTHSVDRSMQRNCAVGAHMECARPTASDSLERRGPEKSGKADMSGVIPTRIVHKERNFFFVGSEKREVVFSTAAQSMEDAWTRFHASPRSTISIMFVIKTETEIYLAQ